MSDLFDPNEFAEALFRMTAAQAEIYRAGMVEGIKIAHRQNRVAPDRGGNVGVFQQLEDTVQVLESRNGLERRDPMAPSPDK